MASTSAPTYTFTREYLLTASDGTAGADKISSQAPNGGTPGTFILKDIAAASGPDDLGVLGDIAGDNFGSDETVNGSNRTFTNRYYLGETSDGSVVMRSLSSTTGRYTYFLYSNSDQYNSGDPITYSNAAFALCFGSGTRILTTRGAIAVEDLRIGDRAVTASGRHRVITWIGQRHLGTPAQPLAPDHAPVRVRADAFGHGLPVRDLLLSPGHPVLVGADADNEGGVLVPVMCLINGTTVARTQADSVTYWHVELDAHDILLAEGLPAESYIDLGTRAWFGGADGLLLDPDFALPGMKGRCRPVAVDGPLVEAERARLDAAFAQTLASDCAWTAEADHLALSCN